MNAKFVGALLVLWAADANLACNKDKSGPSPGPDPAPVTVTVESLPSRTEEEQKASREITSENYKAQLDQLEKEIDNP
jgi:hypothetical protein